MFCCVAFCLRSRRKIGKFFVWKIILHAIITSHVKTAYKNTNLYYYGWLAYICEGNTDAFQTVKRMLWTNKLMSTYWWKQIIKKIMFKERHRRLKLQKVPFYISNQSNHTQLNFAYYKHHIMPQFFNYLSMKPLPGEAWTAMKMSFQLF
jgi:hypothetical protein